MPLKVRLYNAGGGLLGRLGVVPDRATFREESLLLEATRRSGLTDWGDDQPGFREGLRVLLESYERDAHLHFYGRLYRHEACVENLLNRLYLAADLRRH